MAGTQRAKRKAGDDDSSHASKKVKGRKGQSASTKKADLSAFKGVPLDLLPNIFQHLSPNDLVNLCDASPLFWKALCRSSQTSIWKNSRENEDVYEIPDGMNEYQWAKLLFGSRCMECGVEGVKMADFHLRRRICNKCRKDKCIEPRRQTSSNVKFSKDAYACSPVTNLSASGSKALLNEVYWKADVAEQEAKLKALKKNVELDLPGATRALAEYKVSRRKLIRTINSEVDDFEKYQYQWSHKPENVPVDLFQVRYDEIVRRFVELGYSTRDIPHSMQKHKLVRLKTGVTERAWQGIRDAFEEQIRTAKEQREKDRWYSQLSERLNALDKVYAAHKFKHLRPELWKSSPQLPTVCMLPPFNTLLSSDVSRELSKADFEPLIPRIDELLDTAYDELRISLLDHSVTTKDPFLAEILSTKSQALQVASVILRCSRCRSLLFGFQNIHSHRCGPCERPHEIAYREHLSANLVSTIAPEERGTEAARIVIEAFGLDAKTATPAQMDELDKRVRCGCEVAETRRASAFTWHGLIQHILEKHKKSDELASMAKPEIVPEQCMPSIRKEELRVRQDGDFACIRCDAHAGLGSHYDRQISHIRYHAEHDHRNPGYQLGVDFISISNHELFLDRFPSGVSYYVE